MGVADLVALKGLRLFCKKSKTKMSHILRVKTSFFYINMLQETGK